jgi:hypothetical protein
VVLDADTAAWAASGLICLVHTRHAVSISGDRALGLPVLDAVAIIG